MVYMYKASLEPYTIFTDDEGKFFGIVGVSYKGDYIHYKKGDNETFLLSFLALINCGDDFKTLLNIYRDMYFYGVKAIKPLVKMSIDVRVKKIREICSYNSQVSADDTKRIFNEGCAIPSLLEEQKKLRSILTIKKGTVNFSDLIKKAKEFPINQLVEFNRAGFSKCLWHNERTPSMRYYPFSNSVYCFACNKYGDAVDVVQQLDSLDFKGAVNKLS